MKDFQTDGVLRPIIQSAVAGCMPEWAVNAPIPARNDFAKLSSAAFADPTNRLLPVNSKECILWSAAYASAHPGRYPDGSMDRVKAAAVTLELTDEVAAIETFWAAENTEVKEASEQFEKPAFALSLPDGSVFGLCPSPGSVELLPCHDEWHIDKSASELDKAASLQTMPPELIHMAAGTLCKAAAAAGCTDVLPLAVLRLGQERMPDWDRAGRLLGDRQKKAGADFLAYAELIGVGKEHPEFADDVIDGIRDLDTHHGFRYWGSKFASVISPWEAIYSGPLMSDIEKMAATHLVVAGALVPQEALTALPDSKIDGHFGKQAAELIKLAKVSPDNATATANLSELDEAIQTRLFDLLASDDS